MRDALFFGARTYADFAGQKEGIPSNLLAQRDPIGLAGEDNVPTPPAAF